NYTPILTIYTLFLHDALPISNFIDAAAGQRRRCRILIESPNPSGGEMKKRTCHQVALLFLLFHCPGTGWGQVTASITGVVRDVSGAVVPGAAVTVKHVETGTTRTAQTNEDGNYSVPSLPVGQYEVDVQKTAFKQQVRSGITLVV